MGAGILDAVENTLAAIERFTSTVPRRRQPSAPRASASRAPSRGIARSPTRVSASEFSIVEAIDSVTGRPEFVVGNRRGDRASCSSLAFAQRVRDSLG